MANFFHRFGIAWAPHMTTNSTIIFSNYDYMVELTWANENLYAYPNRDFCIFAQFPHFKRTLPVLDSAKLIECTLTISWLTRNY